MSQHGIQNLSAGRLHAHFQERPDLGVRLGLKRLRKVMSERLDLVYGRYRPQRMGARASDLAERRYYVALLLAQAMSDGWMVVALDESALRLDMHRTCQWQPRAERARPGRPVSSKVRPGGGPSAGGPGGLDQGADHPDGGGSQAELRG